MGRAIVRQPKAFLMDEPLSNLDAKLRVQMRAEISRLQHTLGVTTVYVTHDQIEAMTMGDKVAVLNRGELQQVASPQSLYDDPDNLFVAAFIGSPQMNLLQATFHRHDDGYSLKIGSQTVTIPASVITARPSLAGYDGRTVAVGIRPEHVEDASFSTRTDRLEGKVEVREGLGSEVILHLLIDAPSASKQGDDSVASRFLARVDPHTTLQPDDTAQLAIDTTKMHFFDLETGLAIRG
jgi:multiple sugar transport system ATP-binding protein